MEGQGTRTRYAGRTLPLLLLLSRSEDPRSERLADLDGDRADDALWFTGGVRVGGLDPAALLGGELDGEPGGDAFNAGCR